MTRRISPKQANGMLVAGVALLAFAFALALYSVPSEVAQLPEFPFFSLDFPLLSGLVVISTVLVASGWIFHPRGTFGQLLIGSASFVVVGIILVAISFLTAIPFDLGGMTIYVEPYGAHAIMVLSIGPLLTVFGAIFWAVEWRERHRDEVLSRDL